MEADAPTTTKFWATPWKPRRQRAAPVASAAEAPRLPSPTTQELPAFLRSGIPLSKLSVETVSGDKITMERGDTEVVEEAMPAVPGTP